MDGLHTSLIPNVHERAEEYLQVVVNLLLFLAREGDAVVKMYPFLLAERLWLIGHRRFSE